MTDERIQNSQKDESLPSKQPSKSSQVIFLSSLNTISFSRNINLKLKIITMKKILVMIAVALITAMGVNAQNEELRHELSLSYGIGSITQFGDGLGEGLGLIISDTEYDDGLILGPISAEYFYHLKNPRLAIGGFVSYSKWDSDILKRKGDHEKVGERNRSYWSVMPGLKWYMVNKNSFGLYAKGAAGVAFLSNTEKDFELNKSKDDNSTYFLFQLSFIGVEFGKQFRGFAEAGIGEQGFLLAGLRYKF